MGSLPSSCCVDQWASFCNNSSYLVLCPLCNRYLVNSASRSLCSSIRLAVNGMRLLSMRTPGSAWDAMRLNYWNSREIILKCETKWLNNPFFLITLWQGPGWCPESFTVLSLLLSNLDKKNAASTGTIGGHQFWEQGVERWFSVTSNLLKVHFSIRIS